MRGIVCMVLLAASLAAPLPCRAASDSSTIAGGVVLGGVAGAIYEVGVMTTATALAVGVSSAVGAVAVAGLAIVGAVVATSVAVVSGTIAVASAASLPVIIGATGGGLAAWAIGSAVLEQRAAVAE